jgi:hypothetical protein
MRNHRLIYFSVLLVGCGQPPNLVFVDLESIQSSRTKPVTRDQVKSQSMGVNTLESKTIPGDSEKTVENLKAEEKESIRKEVERETNDAVETISKRLHDYYSREIDDFYKAEFAKLKPFKQSLTLDDLKETRSIFEESAKKRGPLLTRLTLLTEFPPPERDLIPLEGKNLSDSEKKRRLEIRSLQNAIIQIDKEYELAIRALESRSGIKVDQETERILARIEAKQTEIDQRASVEASKLVKNFSSNLSKRIFSRYSFQLKEIPTKTLNFPKMAVPSEVPRVTFDRQQLISNERGEITKELEAFLSLNHYQRADKADGAKDVTKEFIEWRTNLKTGHWESWQKSSAQK